LTLRGTESQNKKEEAGAADSIVFVILAIVENLNRGTIMP